MHSSPGTQRFGGAIGSAVGLFLAFLADVVKDSGAVRYARVAVLRTREYICDQ